MSNYVRLDYLIRTDGRRREILSIDERGYVSVHGSFTQDGVAIFAALREWVYAVDNDMEWPAHLPEPESYTISTVACPDVLTFYSHTGVIEYRGREIGIDVGVARRFCYHYCMTSEKA